MATDYVYDITCDRCGKFLCWWRYSGPFQGSCRCDDCKDEEES